MADKVQYVLDRMASTFRQMSELELFTEVEVKSIIKRRTEYEYILCRRQLTAEDFYGYLQYELNLEKLLCLRFETFLSTKRFRESDDQDEGSAALFHDKKKKILHIKSLFIRHVSYVFDRAVRRFPQNLDLWSDYISFLESKKAYSMLGSVLGRAISLMPRNEDFWLFAAKHELEINGNIFSARTLLQRSLRVNRLSERLWLKYFELELVSSLKVVHRQRMLDLERNPELASPFDVPLVVFKHATISISSITFACKFHSIASDAGANELAASLEVKLKEKFSSSDFMWKYLVVHYCTKLLWGNLAGSRRDFYLNEDFDSTEKSFKRRQRAGGASHDLVQSTRALVATRALFQTALSDVSSVKSILPSCLDALSIVLAEIVVVVSRFSDLSLSGVEEIDRLISELFVESSAILEFLSSIISQEGLYSEWDLLSVRAAWFSASDKHNLLHHALVDDSEYLEQSSSCQQWILNQIPLFRSVAITRSQALVRNLDKYWDEKAIDAFQPWCKLTLEYINNSRRIVCDRSSVEVICENVLQIADLAASCDLGSELVNQCVTYLHSAGTPRIIWETAVQSLISSAFWSNKSRLGWWCSNYISLALSHECKAVHKKKKSLEIEADSEPACSVCYDEWDIFNWIRSIERSKPGFFDPHLLCTYCHTTFEMMIGRSMVADKVLYLQRARELVNSSIFMLASKGDVWDARERIEKLAGDIKALQHIKWQRTKDLDC